MASGLVCELRYSRAGFSITMRSLRTFLPLCWAVLFSSSAKVPCCSNTAAGHRVQTPDATSAKSVRQ